MTKRLLPLALVGFAAVYLWQASAIALDPWSAEEAINARTLPVTYACCLLILALALFARPQPDARGDAPSPPASASNRKRWLALAGHCGAIVGFGAAIPWAGPWLALAALLLASLLIAGERRWWVLVAAPAITAAASWALIVAVLGVYIDPGRWFS